MAPRRIGHCSPGAGGGCCGELLDLPHLSAVAGCRRSVLHGEWKGRRTAEEATEVVELAGRSERTREPERHGREWVREGVGRRGNRTALLLLLLLPGATEAGRESIVRCEGGPAMEQSPSPPSPRQTRPICGRCCGRHEAHLS